MAWVGWIRASFEQGGRGRGFWTQNLVYQKWPDQIFPIINFVFSHYGHFGLGRGGGGFGGWVPPPPLVFNYSKEALWIHEGWFRTVELRRRAKLRQQTAAVLRMKTEERPVLRVWEPNPSYPGPPVTPAGTARCSVFYIGG